MIQMFVTAGAITAWLVIGFVSATHMISAEEFDLDDTLDRCTAGFLVLAHLLVWPGFVLVSLFGHLLRMRR